MAGVATQTGASIYWRLHVVADTVALGLMLAPKSDDWVLREDMRHISVASPFADTHPGVMVAFSIVFNGVVVWSSFSQLLPFTFAIAMVVVYNSLFALAYRYVRHERAAGEFVRLDRQLRHIYLPRHSRVLAYKDAIRVSIASSRIPLQLKKQYTLYIVFDLENEERDFEIISSFGRSDEIGRVADTLAGELAVEVAREGNG